MAAATGHPMGYAMTSRFGRLYWGRRTRASTNTLAVVIAIYVDSWLFVFATAIIQFGFGVDYSFPVCDSAILLCLVCYVSSKVQRPFPCHAEGDANTWTDRELSVNSAPRTIRID